MSFRCRVFGHTVSVVTEREDVPVTYQGVNRHAVEYVLSECRCGALFEDIALLLFERETEHGFMRAFAHVERRIERFSDAAVWSGDV